MSGILSADSAFVSTDASVAFDELVRCHRSDLVRFCRRRVGDVDTAEDVVQETLIAAHRAFAHFDGRHPRAWLMEIARNKCIDELRRRGRVASHHRAIPTTVPRSMLKRPVEDVMLRRETWSAFRQALAELSPEHRRLLLLVYGFDLSYDAAAEVTATAIGTVRSRLYRAKAALAAALARAA